MNCSCCGKSPSTAAERVCKRSLTHAGHVFDEEMTARQQPDQGHAHNLGFVG